LEAHGILGSVAFDGQWVTITKRGTGQTMKGARRLSVSQISSITFKPATALYHGYIQFTVAGTPAAGVRESGLAAGRPPREDRDSLSFSKKKNSDFLRLQEAVESAIGSAGKGASLDVVDQLRRLADLRSDGVLTDSEFEVQKARLLNP
jgi:Domain of unknown function (DUF4429)/Short C-terminal domain